jgi:dsRNA-specific ribonuclease
MSNLPVFVFEKEEATGLLRAHVTLPNSIHPSVRRASGVRTWSTEAMARKDAAFQAYVALYNAKLLNDNLLPLSRDMLLGVDGMKDSSSIVNIQQQYNPWHDIAKKWSTPHKSFWKSVNIQWAEYGAILINLLLPVDIPSFEWPPLSPQDGVEYEWSMRVSEGAIDTEICDVSLLRAATKKTLLCFQDYSSMDNQDDFVALFIPQIVSREIQEWLESRLAPFPSTNDWSAGHPTSFKVSYNEKMRRDCFWKIRYRSEDCADSIVTDRELLLANGTNLIEIAKANKKLQVDCSKDGSRAHDISKARIRQKEPSNITQAYQDAQIFALLAPFVMRRLEIQLVGKELRNRLMPNVYFRNWNLLVEAISTTSSRELLNNKRLAFLGDTVLDFLATSQLFANHSIWPAGYLSAKKKLIISNSHLSKMALDVGLDKFIITDPLNPSNWKPPYISDINANVNDVESTRLVSKSILADAVEALIGAAYLDGQYKNALECTQIFLPEIMGHSVGSSFTPTLLDYGHENSIHFAPNHFAPLEELIGYKFRNSTFLAEAITHPSYEQDLEIGSYGRLAFLGSAVLSMVIVESLFQEKPSLSPNQMHLLRTATINNGFLAFICLETHMEEEYVDIQQSASRNFREVHLGRSVRLWGFLRYGNSELGMARRTFLEKHGNTCQYIRERLASGGVYPWLELAKLEQNSDLPDVIQALFGAVFHDSNGDIKQCALLAERLRILPILRQLIQRKVDVLHPKTRLQELVMDRQVTYLPKFESVRNEHSCVIRMNGNIIAEDRGGSCRDEIIIRASELAIMSLEGKSLQ